MKQLGLTDARLMKRSKKTRKEQFLEEKDAIIPWQRLLSAIEPFYPRAARGRRHIPLETLLRIHLLQHFFNYSDPAMEEALYEVPLYCRFVGLDLAVDTIPDETTICKFRHLLEKHRLADRFLAEINAELGDRRKLPRQADILKVEFSTTCLAYKLGGIPPSASWGRWSLYSINQRPVISRTSSRLRKRYRFSTSLR